MRNNEPIIKIGDRLIGENQPCFLIAEAGINHNGSVQIAQQLVNVASDAKADCVKFQLRDLPSLYQQKILDDPSLSERSFQFSLEHIKNSQLTGEEFTYLFNYCNQRDILFLCTPWDKKSVDFLEKIGVKAYKIGSPDMTNFDLLDYVAKTKKPMIVSTGMSSLAEVDATVNFLRKEHAVFALLHCNSTYPAPFHNINLRFMLTLKERYKCIVGYSGHEEGIAVSEAAVAMGASIIERHFTLDRTLPGPDHAASLEPIGLKKIVRDVRQIEEAMGSSVRYLSQGEFANRLVLGKSLYAAKGIKRGEKILKEMVVAKSPGNGLSPQRIDKLIGSIAKRNIAFDSSFTQEDLGQMKNIHAVKNTLRWGIPVRYSDIQELSKIKPAVFEFHFSDYDLGLDSKTLTYDGELVVHCPEYYQNDLLDLSSSDSRIRSLTMDVFKKVILISEKLRPHFNNKKIKVVIHPGGMFRLFSSSSIESNFIDPPHEQMYRNLEVGILNLKKKDVEILIENMPPLPWYFGGEWRHTIFMEAEEIIAFLKKNKMKMCLDISHAALYCNYFKKSLEEYITKLLPYVSHIHLADAAGIDGESLQIGEGEINFTKVMPLLKNFKSGVTVEVWQGHKFGGVGFYQAILSLEEVLSKTKRA